jgi:hypothetical protein
VDQLETLSKNPRLLFKSMEVSAFKNMSCHAYLCVMYCVSVHHIG